MKRYVLYNCVHQQLTEEEIKRPWIIERDMVFLKDITNNVFVRIPWSKPTPRDLHAFVKGYSFGQFKVCDFEVINYEC